MVMIFMVNEKLKIMKKSKKSLRMKLVKLTIKEFVLNRLFDQTNDDWEVELQNNLKDTFSFKCELFKLETINSFLTGQVSVEKEDGEINVIDFVILPTGKILETTIVKI